MRVSDCGVGRRGQNLALVRDHGDRRARSQAWSIGRTQAAGHARADTFLQTSVVSHTGTR
eukprot:5182112-Pleurochrysis_carterae.AAC.1